jgi:hypothetical protein
MRSFGRTALPSRPSRDEIELARKMVRNVKTPGITYLDLSNRDNTESGTETPYAPRGIAGIAICPVFFHQRKERFPWLLS